MDSPFIQDKCCEYRLSEIYNLADILVSPMYDKNIYKWEIILRDNAISFYIEDTIGFMLSNHYFQYQYKIRKLFFQDRSLIYNIMKTYGINGNAWTHDIIDFMDNTMVIDYINVVNRYLLLEFLVMDIK